VDSMGNLFIADSGNHRIRKVSPDGTITTVAGSRPEDPRNGGYAGDGGLALQARLNNPRGIVVDSAGNLFIADIGNDRVRKVSPDGTITTVAGGGSAEPGDGGPATTAALHYPWGVTIDGAGNLFIAEFGSHRVRKVVGVAAPGLLAGGPFPA
jgi:DNA-binding beta-propeller fold protein YncE